MLNFVAWGMKPAAGVIACLLLGATLGFGGEPQRIASCREADNLVEYHNLFNKMSSLPGYRSPTESICAAAVRCAIDQQASFMIVFTTTGLAPRFVSKYRPPMPVISATASPQVARQSYIWRGITPLLLEDMADSQLLCMVSFDPVPPPGCAAISLLFPMQGW